MIVRPAIFKWWQTEPGIILCAVRWYPGYSLSLRDVEELLEERDLNVDHTTAWQWVQYYGAELEQRREGISSDACDRGQMLVRCRRVFRSGSARSTRARQPIPQPSLVKPNP